MSGFEDLLERLTHRLRVDPELQMEVTHELRTHLEDAVAECRAAGMNDQQALATAVKAMGNESEIADQLWQANRQRVRVRKVVRWAAGAALMPAAMAVSVVVTWGAILSIILALPMLTAMTGMGFVGLLDKNPFHAIAESYRQKTLASLPAESQLIVVAWSNDTATSARASEQLVRLHPDDAVFYATYALQGIQTSSGRPDVQQYLDILERGKQVEPDNALYPLLKARLLFSMATRTPVQEQRPVAIQFRHKNVQGRELFWDWDRVEVTDAVILEQALAALHEAATRPRLLSHVADFAQRRADVLPQPTRVSDKILQDELAHAYGRTLYDGLPSGVLHRASNWAAGQIEDGQTALVTGTVGDLRRIAELAVQDASQVSEMQSASQTSVATLYLQAMVLQRLDKPAEFETTLGQIGKQRDTVQWVYKTGSASQPARQAGMIDMQRTWYLDMNKADLSAGRRADYAMLDRVALSISLVILTASATLIGAWAIVRRLRTERWPVMAFIGWRRLAKVVGISTLVPLGIYAAYAWLTPMGARTYGTQASLERVLVEYAAVGCTIVLLLRILGAGALQRRAVELGTAELHTEVLPQSWRMCLHTDSCRSGLLLAAALVAYLVAWHWAVPRFGSGQWMVTGGWGFLLAISLAIYPLTWTNLTTAESCRRSTWWQYVPAGLAWLATGVALLSAFGYVGNNPPWMAKVTYLYGSLGYLIPLPLGLAAALLLAAEAFMAQPRGAGQAVFSRTLSFAPVILLAALVLATMSLPLRLQEKQAVAAQRGSGQADDLQQSTWKTVQERLCSMAESSVDIQ